MVQTSSNLKATPCLIIYVGKKNDKTVLQPIEIKEFNDITIRQSHG